MVEQFVSVFFELATLFVIELVPFGFVDRSMSESSFITTLVDDHSIFHIISSVTDDSDNSIDSTWVVRHTILFKLIWFYQGYLGSSINKGFIIESITSIVIGSP